MKRFPFALLGSIMVALMLTQPVSAASLAMSYPDQRNDLAKWIYITSMDPYSYVSGPPWPDNSKVGKVGYCDIAMGRLTHKGDSYIFGMEVADKLPSKGGIPGVNYAVWGFVAVFGNDFNNAIDVFLMWDGENYQAFVQDSRPIMNGGEWAYTSIPYTVDGAKLTVTVNARQFDVPSEFYWTFRTVIFTGTFDPSDFKGGTIFIVDQTDAEYVASPFPYPDLWFAQLLPWPPQ